MVWFDAENFSLVGDSGSLEVPDEDEITHKLACSSKVSAKDLVPLRRLRNSTSADSAISKSVARSKTKVRWHYSVKNGVPSETTGAPKRLSAKSFDIAFSTRRPRPM